MGWIDIIERSFFFGGCDALHPICLRFRHGSRREAACAPLGAARCADALHAARLDGRRRVVPVRRRRARGRLAGDRARRTRLRPVRLAGRRARRRPLLVPRIPGGPRGADRPLHARWRSESRRPQHGRERRVPLCGRAAAAGAARRRSGGLRARAGASRAGAAASRAVARRAARAAGAQALRVARRRRRAPREDESAPRAAPRIGRPATRTAGTGCSRIPRTSCAARCCTGSTR